MAAFEINDDLKIRWAQLITILTGTVAVTTLLVSLRFEVSSLNDTMVEVVNQLKDHSIRLNTIEWNNGRK